MKDILEVFAEKTGLEKYEDFDIIQGGGTGYCHLSIVKNGKFFRLGEFYYGAFIRNEFNDLRNPTSLKMMYKFIEIAIQYMNGESKMKPPTLYGNYFFNIRAYKELIDFDESTLIACQKHFEK